MLGFSVYYKTYLTSFICLYFATMYFKEIEKNMTDRNLLQIVSGGVVFYLLSIILLQYIGLYIDSSYIWMTNFCFFTNPFILMICIPLVVLASRYEGFHSKIINHLSSLSLVIYLIHENLIVGKFVKPYIWDCFNNYGFTVIEGTLLLSFLSLVCSIFIGELYLHAFQKLKFKVVSSIDKKYSSHFNFYNER